MKTTEMTNCVTTNPFRIQRSPKEVISFPFRILPDQTRINKTQGSIRKQFR